MKTNDFDYQLPEHLIAQTPLLDRSSSKLLVLDRQMGTYQHHLFHDIITMLDHNDCLILNDTLVIPSRLWGEKITTNAKIEVLLLKEVVTDCWQALVKPARRVNVGQKIIFGNGLLMAEVIEVHDDGIRTLKMTYQGIFLNILAQIGTMPLPPYIHQQLVDQSRYQTVYAKASGSAAAPTAGFHFTKELLEKLINKGVQIEYITLHVGLGTFRPVMVDEIENHHMHEEHFSINEDVANRLNDAKRIGKRLISVGTTTTRTLESNYNKYGCFVGETSQTNIFIYPPYTFKAVDALITNFHLPKSTLLMLISAFSQKEYIMAAYQAAIEKSYRFFSFGDAMFITNKK